MYFKEEEIDKKKAATLLCTSLTAVFNTTTTNLLREGLPDGRCHAYFIHGTPTP